jgi:mRNA degradation ribonuclease J1/J2
MTETDWAIRNLELAGWFKSDSDYGGMIGKAVKKLLLVHSQEGHSGASHYLTVGLFHAVAGGKALTMEFWREKFNAYNEFAKENGGEPWTEESFEETVMKKPERGE